MRRAFGCMIVAALLASGVAAPAGAGRDAGEAALRRGDFAAALAEFRPLAKAGDAQSRFDLGVLHQHGWGTPRDTAAAIAWYEKAARQGHVLARHNLGVIYVYGQGVAQSDVRAYFWFSLAAVAPPGDRRHQPRPYRRADERGGARRGRCAGRGVGGCMGEVKNPPYHHVRGVLVRSSVPSAVTMKFCSKPALPTPSSAMKVSVDMTMPSAMTWCLPL